MPLLAFWSSNPKEVGQSTIEQIVAMAGDGNLRDNSTCSAELREYLTEVESTKLGSYIAHCLQSDLPYAFAIPLNIVRANLDSLNTTKTDRTTYWHIHLVETEKGIALQLPKISQQLSLEPFRLPF